MIAKVHLSLLIVVTILLVAFIIRVFASDRSNAVRHAFVKQQACPATNEHTLPCPGWILDHIVPLCAGGKDAVENLMWQTVAAAKEKDVFEKRACACFRGRR